MDAHPYILDAPAPMRHLVCHITLTVQIARPAPAGSLVLGKFIIVDIIRYHSVACVAFCNQSGTSLYSESEYDVTEPM